MNKTGLERIKRGQTPGKVPDFVHAAFPPYIMPHAPPLNIRRRPVMALCKR